jgi:hypothetical protein
MSDDDKNPRPPVPSIADGSKDDAVIFVINEQYRRTQNAASMSNVVLPPPVPPPSPPVFPYDGSADATMIAIWEARRRQSFVAAATGTGTGTPYVPEQDFPVLVSQAVIIPQEKTAEGHLIRAVTLPLMAISRKFWKTHRACTRSTRVNGKRSSPRVMMNPVSSMM